MKTKERQKVYSTPTMCLSCQQIVEMFHWSDEDPVKGSWQCPRCDRLYLFAHWKIKPNKNRPK